MGVDKHPSRRPSEPRRPPATSTTAGTINKMPESASGQAGVEYGARHELSVYDGAESTMEHHFHDHGHPIHKLSADRGFAPHAGKEHPDEGTTSRDSRPGDENKEDEPD